MNDNKNSKEPKNNFYKINELIKSSQFQNNLQTLAKSLDGLHLTNQKIIQESCAKMATMIDISKSLTSLNSFSAPASTSIAVADASFLSSPLLKIFDYREQISNLTSINSNLLELNKVDLPSIVSISKSLDQSINITNDYWKSYFDINKKINESFKKMALSAQIDLSADKSIKDFQTFLQEALVSNSKVFQMQYISLKGLPESVKEEVLEIYSAEEVEIIDQIKKLKSSIELQGVQMFWKKKGEPYEQTESIAQGVMSSLLDSTLSDKFVINPHTSVGIGIVDILINYFNGKTVNSFLIEIKIVRSKADLENGIQQLFNYQKNKKAKTSVRLIINLLEEEFEDSERQEGEFRQVDVSINVNPPRPSDLDKRKK